MSVTTSPSLLHERSRDARRRRPTGGAGTIANMHDPRRGIPAGSRAELRPRRPGTFAPALVAVAMMVVAACGGSGPTPTPPVVATAAASGPASPTLATAAPTATPAVAPVASGPLASLAAPTPETSRTAHIPVVTCPTTFGLPDETMAPVPSTMTATVSAAVAAQVTFYGNGTRTLLGPKGWHCEAAVGADGSTSMTITPPVQTTPTGSPPAGYQAVTAYTGGGCVGCIATMACGLFPEAWKLFDTPGSSCPTTSPARELITRPIPRSAIFEDPPGVAGTGDPSGGRYRALGLLVFDPGTGGSGTDFPSALKITCTLPDAMAQVCDEIVEGAR